MIKNEQILNPLFHNVTPVAPRLKILINFLKNVKKL